MKNELLQIREYAKCEMQKTNLYDRFLFATHQATSIICEFHFTLHKDDFQVST
jgi:hypothetical protein